MSTVRAETLRFEEVAVGDTLPELVLPLDRTLIVATAIARGLSGFLWAEMTA